MGRRTTNTAPPPPLLVPSGSTLFNMAASGTPYGAFKLGTMSIQIGDSSAGKTLQALTMLAECAYNPAFDAYRLVLRDTENSLSFNLKNMFGKKAARRIEILNVDTEDEAEQMSIQEWKKEIISIMDEGPCIYALDSVDGLTTDEEKKRIKDEKAGKKPSGTMGMEKAKYASNCLRMVCSGLSKSKSFLLANFQTREDIDPMTFTTKTRAGGTAWKFYAQHEWWLANARKNAKIMKERQRRKRQIGITSTAKMTKNKFTGKAGWEITMPMFFGYGIDDVGSCVDWLTDEGWWGMSKMTIDAEDLDIKGSRNKVIAAIEEGGLEKELQKVVAEAWVEIERDYAPERKPRFGE